MNKIFIVILGIIVIASLHACKESEGYVYTDAYDSTSADSVKHYKELYNELLGRNAKLKSDQTLYEKQLGKLRQDTSKNQLKIKELEQTLQNKAEEIQYVKNQVNELIGCIEKNLRNSDKYEDTTTTQTMAERKNKRMSDMLDLVNSLYAFVGKVNDKPDDIEEMLRQYCGGVTLTQREIDSIYQQGFIEGYKAADSLWRIKYKRDIDSLKGIIESNNSAIQKLRNKVDSLDSVVKVREQQHSIDEATIDRLEGEKENAQNTITSLEQDNLKLKEEIERRDAIINMRPSFEFDIKRKFFSDKLKINRGETFSIPFVVNENEHMKTLKEYTIYFAIGESSITRAAEGMKPIRINNDKDKYIPNNECPWKDIKGVDWIYHAKCTFYWTGDKVEKPLTITNATDNDISIKGEDIKYYYLVFENDKFIVGYTQCTIKNPVGIRIEGGAN